MIKVHYLRVTAIPTGILAIRSQPQSKMRLSFLFPPFTTLLGALAYPFLHVQGDRAEVMMEQRETKSAMNKLKKFIQWITIRISEIPRIHGSILKIHQIYRGKLLAAVTSFPFSLYYGYNGYDMDLVYILDEEQVESSSFSLYYFSRAAWGITRIGSRESVVSVEQVKTGNTKITESVSTKTRYAFLYDNRNVEGSGTIQSIVDWREDPSDYSIAPRVLVFYPKEEVTVKSEDQFPLNVVTVEGEEVIIG